MKETREEEENRIILTIISKKRNRKASKWKNMREWIIMQPPEQPPVGWRLGAGGWGPLPFDFGGGFWGRLLGAAFGGGFWGRLLGAAFEGGLRPASCRLPPACRLLAAGHHSAACWPPFCRLLATILPPAGCWLLAAGLLAW